MRNNKHQKVTPIGSKQYLMGQISKDTTKDQVEDITNSLRTKIETVPEASHDTQIANMKASMQCNNGTETNSDYTLSHNTTN